MEARRRFEQWAKEQSKSFDCPWFDSPSFAETDADGRYCNHSVQFAWLAWHFASHN